MCLLAKCGAEKGGLGISLQQRVENTGGHQGHSATLHHKGKETAKGEANFSCLGEGGLKCFHVFKSSIIQNLNFGVGVSTQKGKVNISP